MFKIGSETLIMMLGQAEPFTVYHLHVMTRQNVGHLGKLLPAQGCSADSLSAISQWRWGPPIIRPCLFGASGRGVLKEV
jgi:hypothetical protein